MKNNNSSKKQKLKLQVLMKEHEIITLHIHQQLSSNDKFVSIALTFILLGFFVAIKEEIFLMIHFLTILFGGLILYGLYHYIIIFSNVGYLKRIEEEINTKIKKNYLVRTTIWDKTLVNNFTLIIIILIIALIYGILIFFSLNNTGINSPILFTKFWILTIIYSIEVVSITISFFMIFRVYEKAYHISNNSFET